MKRGIFLAAVWMVGLLLTSCVVTSTNPAVDLGDSVPIPDEWLGTWTVEQIVDEAPTQPTTLEMEANGDGSVQLTLRGGDRASVQSASLADVGGSRIASVLAPDGSWTLLRIVTDPGQTQMTVQALDPTILKEDVRQGLIAGNLQGFGADEVNVSLSATSAEIRAYLASRVAAFENNTVAVLRKVPQT